MPKLLPRLHSVTPRATDLGQSILLRSLGGHGSVNLQSTRARTHIHTQKNGRWSSRGHSVIPWSQETDLTSQLY